MLQLLCSLFISGLGLGINQTASMVAISRYFDKYRVFALGIASMGNNIGLISFARLIMFLDHLYGWRGMLLVCGGVTFHLCPLAAVMFPVTEVKPSMAIEESNSMLQKTTSYTTTVKKMNSNINFGLFRKVSFVCFCISNVFFNTGMGIFSLHLPSYSKQAGFKDNDIGTMWLAHGMCNIIGKVLFSFLGQHRRVNPTIVYAVGVVLGGLSIGIIPNVFNKTGIIVASGACGFFTCVTGALIQTVIYDIVGYERFADGNGMSMPFKAMGNLIGGPIAGKYAILMSMVKQKP